MLELLAVAAAGAAAGASNAIAGAGSLITFPTMVALGLPPLSANVTNTVGIVPGYVGGVLGYTDLLREQGARFGRFLVPMLTGAVAGTVALLLTSDAAFEAIVPGLIAASCLLLLFQPRLTPRISHAGDERSPFLVAGILFCGAYGAYFGSAVSILLFAILALFVADTLQHLNAMKIILVGCSNLLAAVVYAFLAPVDRLLDGGGHGQVVVDVPAGCQAQPFEADPTSRHAFSSFRNPSRWPCRGGARCAAVMVPAPRCGGQPGNAPAIRSGD